MKKIALLLVVVLVLASMSVLLFACSAKVAGKTYVLESVEVTCDEASEEIIAQAKSTLENQYKNAELIFNKDGTMILKSGELEQKSYYKQVKNNIYTSTTEDVKTDGTPTLVVEGKKLVWSMTQTVASYTFNAKITVVEKK
ncbi:MAG: hypothetical protein E7338_01380 [Clostridiales bacterium]|nr:hypothetical protein [Clostridiales bacterium]